MSKELEALIAAARKVQLTPEQVEEQRRSFAYGNTRFENDNVTREAIDQAAEALQASNEKDRSSRR